MAWAALLKGAKAVQTAQTVKGAIGGKKKKGGALVKKERPQMGQFVKDVEQTKVETAPKQKLVPTLALPQAASPGEEKSKKIEEKISLLLKFVRERKGIKAERRKQRDAANLDAKRKEKEAKKENLGKGLVKGAKNIGGKILAPVKSLWDNIMNAIGTIVMAYVGMWAVDNPEKFLGILKALIGIVDVVSNVILGALDIFGGIVKFGYDLVDGFGDWVESTLGEDAAAKLDEWGPKITGFLNGAIILAQVMIAKSLWESTQGGLKGKLPKPVRMFVTRIRRKLYVFIGRRMQWFKALKQAWWKKFRTGGVGRAMRGVRALARRPDKWIRRGLRNINMGGAVDWVKSIPAKTRKLYNNLAKKMGPYIDEIGEGVAKAGKNIGAKWTEVTKNLNPQKYIDDLMAKIKPVIDDVLKKSPILNKLSKGLNPKSVQGLLTKAANNPALKKILNTLKASKGASKALGPVDKIITALMTLANYVGGGESPINAILKGLGGLLGYGVGFSAATASIVSFPALGAIPGLPFMGGIAGGIAGEWLAMKIAKVLAKTPLADIDDPIMGPKDIEAGLPARKLVRDPDGLLDHMIPGAKLNMDPAKGEGEGSDSKPTSLKSVPVKATPDNTKGVKSTSAQSVPTINQGGSSGSGGGSSAGGGTTSQPQEGQAAIIPMPTPQNTSPPAKSGATSSINVERQFTTGQMAKS